MKRHGRVADYYFIYLCNCVLSLDDGEDSLLLDGRRVLETEGVDATQDFLLESHVVKIINFQFPVRFEKFFSFLYKEYKHYWLVSPPLTLTLGKHPDFDDDTSRHPCVGGDLSAARLLTFCCHSILSFVLLILLSRNVTPEVVLGTRHFSSVSVVTKR